MTVKIRLARGGAKKRPYYRVVIANDTAPRDGKFIEKVGTYDPLLDATNVNRVTLKSERIEYWLSKGAKPTDRVAKFIEAAGIKLPKIVKTKLQIKAKNQTIKPPKKVASE